MKILLFVAGVHVARVDHRLGIGKVVRSVPYALASKSKVCGLRAKGSAIK